tara:strand:+ start:329 stop:1663 length:1335 start_codon:yes stop_codon:yes gene_type:complete
MKKCHATLALITTTILLISPLTQATNINITIAGNGEVKIKETAISCTESCTLTNDLAISTLVSTANSGWSFTGWSGQQCDSGKQVLIDANYKNLSSALGGAKTIKTGDINLDSLDDFITVDLFNGAISANINQGNGQFETTEVDSDLNYPSALDLYDADNDGDLDLYLAEYGNAMIKIYLNDGNGHFTLSEDIKISGIKPYAFKVLDKNDDGQNDILISSFQANISGDLWVLVDSIKTPKTQWYLNNNGSYSAEEVVSELAAITLDAYKNNGVISVVAAEITNSTITHYRAGISTVVDTGRGAYGAAFGDIDKDGNMDILAAHYQPSKLNLIYGTAGGTFTNAKLITAPDNGVTATAFGDYNNDGYLDVATSEFNEKIFYYFATKSYKDCTISTDGDISLTATFTASTESKPIEEEKSTGSSGGGSFSYSLLILGLLVRYKRTR